MEFKKKTILFITFLLLFVTFAGFVFGSGESEVDWPTSPITGRDIGGNTELHDLVAYLYGWGIMIAILATFGMIVFGGFLWMTSEGDSKKLANARSKITSALLGLLFALASWLILNTINPQMTTLTPLTNIWDEIYFAPANLPEDAFSSPSCSFVILYTGENFSGGEHKASPGDSVTRMSTDTTDGPSRTTTRASFLSGKGFVKKNDLSSEELDSLKDNPHIETRDDHIQYNGACIVIIYKSGGLFREDREIGMIPLENINFSEAVWDDATPFKYEIRSIN